MYATLRIVWYPSFSFNDSFNFSKKKKNDVRTAKTQIDQLARVQGLFCPSKETVGPLGIH